MNFQNIKKAKISFVISILVALASSMFAQEKENDKSSTYRYDETNEEIAIAGHTNLYCAGYIQSSDIDANLEIVGASNEKERHVYAQGDELYINSGSNTGIKVGDVFSVIRLRGKFKSKFSKKKDLGIYVQEVGSVEVIRVRRDFSIARVRTSCEVILLGDLLTKVPKRKSPIFKPRPVLDIFTSPSQKVSGRIIMAKDGIEVPGRDNIVYIDLGREDNIKVGDYMTIYRPLGTGNIYKEVPAEEMNAKDGGFESDRYRGGGFSNQAPRSKGTGISGLLGVGGNLVTSENAKSRRPKELRKIVGELVVLNVLEKTATAVILRTASEIHTGDHVEVQ